MNRAFQSWTPRTRPLDYDSLRQDSGCQATHGNAAFSVQPFVRICIFPHNADPFGVFEQPDTVSYTVGPETIGGALPWVTSWAAWVASAGIRIAKLPAVTPPANSTGSASSLYPTTKPSKVSIGFTNDGQIAIAIQKTATAIEIKYGSETFSFVGVSGVLFQTSIMQSLDDEDESDLVVYYTRKETPSTIFVRSAREDFATEHVLNENLQANITRIISVEKVGDQVVLYGRDEFGRDVTLYSSLYILTIDGDSLGLSSEIVSGSYRESAVEETTPTQAALLEVSISSGSYHNPIKEPAAPLSGDEATLTVSIDSGEYL
jgi:hypothetical protein